MTSETEYLKEIIKDIPKTLEKAHVILEKQALAGIVSILYYDENYPIRFSQNLGMDAPPLIHLLGNKELITSDHCVTIIGARNANKEGLSAAYQLAKSFASDGHPIVSGLALGCDTAAHQGCLDVGGKTIAVVASGLDITHPKIKKHCRMK